MEAFCIAIKQIPCHASIRYEMHAGRSKQKILAEGRSISNSLGFVSLLVPRKHVT